ncbi:hypothetical protein [Dactylosporangium matsuzakiense]|uniref:Uncharacterized protein n=1 Tax=Dactylosporangium matsuzakiense TaxID=53360 RepID=A0A9W6KMQ9_9ACTN|nr:hypothetical protein [Dactylosporangium matsuzakiense]UWZ48669.1 hypothetical protein Dmats_21030 [Dactylosporangium matsuzakiense]GLL03035.1 hypothetical protein GCM10017581_047780 [Dactylosporangium matsuzakiense]
MAPGWLAGWCRERLGAEPVTVLFEVVQTSAVFGLRLSDFEAQNLRWYRGRPRTIHDWDSLAWQPEAALAGAASAAFARSSGPPTLPPVDSSAAFLVAYQDSRGRAFTAAEVEVAWAASVWPAAHNARWEVLHGRPPVCGDALRAQAAERLRLAGA